MSYRLNAYPFKLVIRSPSSVILSEAKDLSSEILRQNAPQDDDGVGLSGQLKPCRLIFLMVFIAGFLGPLPGVCGEGASMENKTISQLQVTADSFQSNGMIPAKHTCDGPNISPILRWKGVPKNAQSIALIADDPDAPNGDWVHWILYDLPSTVDMLPEGLPKEESLLNGEKQGTTDFGSVGYGGPCPPLLLASPSFGEASPPSGTHRYFFKIYALDTFLGLNAGATKKQLLAAMEGRIVAQGELVGRYERSSKK